MSHISLVAFGRRGAGVASIVLADLGQCTDLDFCILFGTLVAFLNVTAVN